jgi:hypothetical protein
MQQATSPGVTTPAFWNMMTRLRLYRRKHGPELCRKNGFGLVRAELAMTIEGFTSPDEQFHQREALLEVSRECHKCQLCGLGRE